MSTIVRLSHTTAVNRIDINPSARRTEIGIARRKYLPHPKPSLSDVLDKGIHGLIKWIKTRKTII